MGLIGFEELVDLICFSNNYCAFEMHFFVFGKRRGRPGLSTACRALLHNSSLRGQGQVKEREIAFESVLKGDVVPPLSSTKDFKVCLALFLGLKGGGKTGEGFRTRWKELDTSSARSVRICGADERLVVEEEAGWWR